jgi:poly-gamma-glutamate synthase PgsB/CapB
LQLKKIPLKIAVTGTRGKSSITRTLASILRNNGLVVLAKTTGTEAMYILPDGNELPVKRLGKTSIIEQKKLVRKAVKLKADCLVTELMSIQPECHYTETHRLLKPDLVILSNLRPDHIHLQGETPEEISECYIHDIYPGSTVVLHEEDITSILRAALQKNKVKILTDKNDLAKNLKISGVAAQQQFTENLDLVCTAAMHLKVDQETIQKGVEKAQLDKGKLEIFTLEQDNKTLFFINSFAANDPVSTYQVIQKVTGMINRDNIHPIGLLSLRSDRGERSHQWLKWFMQNGLSPLQKIYLVGAHKRIIGKKLPDTEIIHSGRPDEIMNHIIHQCPDGSVVFGMGNFHGVGKKMVAYWEKTVNKSYQMKRANIDIE